MAQDTLSGDAVGVMATVLSTPYRWAYQHSWDA